MRVAASWGAGRRGPLPMAGTVDVVAKETDVPPCVCFEMYTNHGVARGV